MAEIEQLKKQNADLLLALRRFLDGAWTPDMIARARALVAGESPPCTCPSGLGGLQWPCPAHPPASTPAAANAAGLTDREIMEEWDRHYLPGKANGVPFLQTVVEFARHFMERPAAADAGGLYPQTADPFVERDQSKTAEHQGVFRKFEVRRADGKDAPGEKHHNCVYFVLDLSHDPFAIPAMHAYAAACEKTHPALAQDIWIAHGKPAATDRATAVGTADQEGGAA